MQICGFLLLLDEFVSLNVNHCYNTAHPLSFTVLNIFLSLSPDELKLILNDCYFILTIYSISSSCISQVAEKLLNNKALEFYKWDDDLPRLLQNVRDKLNKVAEVSFLNFLNYLCALLSNFLRNNQ